MISKNSRGRTRDVVGAPCITLTERWFRQTGNTNNGGDGMISKNSRGRTRGLYSDLFWISKRDHPE